MSELDSLKLLRRIDEGVAGKTGEAFFRQIVCDLSRALGAHGAFTSRLLPNRRAGMLAFWVGGDYSPCLEYALDGTPCEFVYRGEISAFPRAVGDIFPVDRAWFEQLGVQSYLGIPIKDDTGAVCGHLAVMDSRERDWADADVDVLRLFSLRSAAEIERTRYQSELESANQALQDANSRLEAEIAHRVAAEEQLASAKAAAESANHAKSVFISQMSHELRTPLNGILGFTQLLRREDAVSRERVQESLGVIERSGEHLLNLVNDLLDLAKIESGKLEVSSGRVDLRELLDHVASLARVRATKAGVTLEVDTEADALAPVLTDERLVRQVLLNLLGNAVKFTDRGGRITLRAHPLPAAGARQGVRFTVEDTGIGIDESELPRIFEPFHRVVQTDRVVEGTGLGLTITQRLVMALDGRLSVESRRGSGSTFTVDCEFDVAPATQAVTFSASEIEGYAGTARVVLVADDDRDNLQLVSDLLRRVGFVVQTASDGREALTRLQDVRADLVLTDLVMPSMGGLALVQALQQSPPSARVPIIVMSASASSSTRQETLEAGCAAFLPKPLKLADLLKTIGDQLSLEWRYKDKLSGNPSPGSGPASAAGSFRLSADVAAELRHLALQGDVLGITARLDAISVSDSNARDFCGEIQKLAARFDIRGMRQALEAQCDQAVSRELTG